jgi:sugar/nucleoside kinase (ribokinase family)
VVNSAFVLQNLAQKVALLGCVGQDIWAEKVKQELAHTSIVEDFICVKPIIRPGSRLSL